MLVNICVKMEIRWFIRKKRRTVDTFLKKYVDLLAHDVSKKAMLVKSLYWLSTGAVEKQKLVYILNRDAQARLTISSPLEAHKSNTLVYHMIGIDVGFENPTFACLEIDYEVS